MKTLLLLTLIVATSFAINISSCEVIISSGVYQLNTSLVGAVTPLAPLIFADKACIFIDSSNVYLDGSGFNVTNNGTLNAIGIFTNHSRTNITIINFNNITQYEYGIYNYVGGSINITANNIQNNSLDNIHLDTSENNTISNNIISLGGSDGVILEKSNNNTVNNNQISQTSQFGIQIDSVSVNNIINNNNINNSAFGILSQAFNSSIINNRITNSTNGIVAGGTNAQNNIINGNIISLSSQYAIWINQAENTTISFNDINNNFVGYYITFSVTGTTAYGNQVYNNNYGSTVSVTNLTYIHDEHYYNNDNDFYVNNIPSDVPVIMNASGLIFDNPNGNFANYSNISINDMIEAKAVYIINWSNQPATLPANEISFNNKFLNITSQNLSHAIDQFIWKWLVSEEVGYDTSQLKILLYNNSWVNTSFTLNTITRTLTQNNLINSGVYGITQVGSNATNITNLTIVLVSPPNNQVILGNTTNLTFYVIDSFFPSVNCSVSLNGTFLTINDTVMNNTLTGVNTTQLNPGTYNWFVICLDANNTVTSETWIFIVRGASARSFPGSNIMLITYSLILYGLWYLTDKKLGKRFNSVLKYSTLVIIIFFTLLNINMIIEFNRYIQVQQYSPNGFVYNDPNTGTSTIMYGAATIDSGTVLSYHFSEYVIWIVLSTLLPYMFLLVMFLIIVQIASLFYDIYLGKGDDNGKK